MYCASVKKWPGGGWDAFVPRIVLGLWLFTYVTTRTGLYPVYSFRVYIIAMGKILFSSRLSTRLFPFDAFICPTALSRMLQNDSDVLHKEIEISFWFFREGFRYHFHWCNVDKTAVCRMYCNIIMMMMICVLPFCWPHSTVHNINFCRLAYHSFRSRQHYLIK